MKIIPKFLTGGNFNRFSNRFTTYTSNIRQTSQQTQPQQVSRTSSRKDDDEESTKGKLTEKDLFTMIEKINALPNERRAIISSLKDMLDDNYLKYADSSDIRMMYLTALDTISQAKYNSDTFTKIKESLSTKDAFSDPAITTDGKVMVINSDGELGTVTATEYLENNEDYLILTNSDLVTMREYSSSFINDYKSFSTLLNAVSTKTFQEYIDAAEKDLKTMEYTREGLFSIENGKVAKGLEVLRNLQLNDLVQAMGSVTADGLYEYKIIDKDDKQSLLALTAYIVSTMPANIRTWAGLKTGLGDKGLKTLVETYLISQSSPSHDFQIDYKGSMEKVSKGSNGSGSNEDPKMGFWALVQANTVGNDSSFLISPDDSYQSVDAKYLGSTPGLDSDKSLQQYLIDSGLGNMRISKETITFGDVVISEESFKDLVVKASSGAYNAILPINPDGTVNLSLSKLYADIINKLELLGLQKGTDEYNRKQKELMEDVPELSLLIKSDGSLNASRFGQFIILEGIANSNTLGKTYNNRDFISMDNIESNFVQNRSDDDNLKNITLSALSSKESGSYEIDNFLFINPFDWGSLLYTNFYTGMIYIPISPNRNTASLADNNIQKESTVYDYEAGYLNLKKLNNLNDTSSK